ncbi:MAG: antitoxin [Gammaproteobacteria bacterium]|nr:antitoxin [Gammaproteobacteria bacterium]MBU1653465.1 antitoxin [Gammaproteobacteria bacterium]MBU1962764.1 antitoxin [Gammaproteobacteria bacterium]
MVQIEADSPSGSESRTARLFRNGSNQAVRLPKEYEMDADEVIIHKEGNRLILTPRPRSWDDYFIQGTRLSADFFDEVEDLPLQERESL